MKPIQLKYEIKASPAEVWEALTDKKLIENWSDSEAEMDLSEGGKFSLWGGDIVGVNLEIIPRKKLVQDWKEKKWKEFSQCTFTLSSKDGGTHLELIHDNVPDSSWKSIKDGWHLYYLRPMKELLEKK